MRRVAVLTLVLALTLLPLTAYCQPRYWIALNYVVTFRGDGTAVVTAKFHPFTAEGTSLYGNKTIEEQLRNETRELINEMLLMFTTRPRAAKYKILTELRANDSTIAYCDVYNVGNFTELKGAYELSILLYLNTTEFVRVKDGVVVVRLRDSYTSRDPRSWIDVLEIRAEAGAEILRYEWEPKDAKGPDKAERNVLVWLNKNEPEAPDFYLIELRMPGFKSSRKFVAVKAEIIEAVAKRGKLYVKVKGVYGEGPVIVRVAGGRVEQARKVNVRPGETVTVVLSLTPGSSKVELWASGVKLDEKSIEVAVGRTFKYEKIAICLAVIGAVLLVVGALRPSPEKKEELPSFAS